MDGSLRIPPLAVRTPRWALALLLGLALALVLMWQPAEPARAAFPGANGKIAFHSDRSGNSDIFTMNADGSNQTNVSNNAGGDFFPDWSPEGTKIAFTSDRSGTYQIYSMNADGGGVMQLTDYASGAAFPAWSPDGTKIAFSAAIDAGPGGLHIFVVNADGTNPHPLPGAGEAGPDTSPAWSPDGTRIAFTHDSPLDSDIFIYNVQSMILDDITLNDYDDLEPDWAPDGSKIVFEARPASVADVYVVNPDGTGQTDLPNPPPGLKPAFSPNGTKIAFEGSDSNDLEVWVMNSDGSSPVNITDNPASDGSPSWQPLGPVGGLAGFPDVGPGPGSSARDFAALAVLGALVVVAMGAWSAGRRRAS